MSCIVKSRSPNGVVYVYRSTSVWNAEKKMSVPKRQLIGKIDPAYTDIINMPTQSLDILANKG